MIRHPKYNRGNLYLSGGMQYKKNLGAGWRRNSSTKLLEMSYFPIDICELDRDYAKHHGELFYSYDENFSHKEMIQFKSNIRKHFIYTDLELVKKDSDAILVLWDESAQRGGGTHAEVTCAYENDIPIFIMTTIPIREIPGWVQAESTKIFTKWETLYTYLENLPYGILCRDAYGNRRSGEHYLCSLCGDPFKKQKHHFVSTVSPLYCNSCVDAVTHTHEQMKDRYDHFVEFYETEALEEMKKENSNGT